MVKGEWFGSAEPIVNFNRPHPDSHLSSPPADSHCNMSIGIGNSTQPFHQQFSPSLHQAGDNFTAAPNPAAQYTGGPTRYGLGGNHAGMVGHYGMGGNGGNHTSDYGPGHHQSGGNNPNASMPSGQYAGQYSSQYGGPSDGPTQEMHDEMKVKDEVITELAGIVEMLEINYGISIDDQTDTVQKFLNIARSMEEEARETVSSKGKYPSANVLVRLQ